MAGQSSLTTCSEQERFIDQAELTPVKEPVSGTIQNHIDAEEVEDNGIKREGSVASLKDI